MLSDKNQKWYLLTIKTKMNSFFNQLINIKFELVCNL